MNLNPRSCWPPPQCPRSRSPRSLPTSRTKWTSSRSTTTMSGSCRPIWSDSRPRRDQDLRAVPQAADAVFRGGRPPIDATKLGLAKLGILMVHFATDPDGQIFIADDLVPRFVGKPGTAADLIAGGAAQGCQVRNGQRLRPVAVAQAQSQRSGPPLLPPLHAHSDGGLRRRAEVEVDYPLRGKTGSAKPEREPYCPGLKVGLVPFG